MRQFYLEVSKALKTEAIPTAVIDSGDESMQTAMRVFFCKTCRTRGSLEELTSGVYVVACTDCETAEIWGSESLHAPLHSFDYYDQPLVIGVA